MNKILTLALLLGSTQAFAGIDVKLYEKCVADPINYCVEDAARSRVVSEMGSLEYLFADGEKLNAKIAEAKKPEDVVKCRSDLADPKAQAAFCMKYAYVFNPKL